MAGAEVEQSLQPFAAVFGRRPRPPSATAPLPERPVPGGGLLALARSGGPASCDLVAQCGPCLLLVQPLTARVRARSLVQLRAAGDRLLSPGWSLEPAAGWPAPADPDWIEARLDPFLLDACVGRESRLPSLAGVRFRLARWPEMGGNRQAWNSRLWNNAHHVAAEIAVPSGTTLDRLARRNLLAEQRLNALLWALWCGGCAAPA